jgi:hypothetical protein
MSTGEKVKFYMYFGVQIPSPASKNISSFGKALTWFLRQMTKRKKKKK